MAGPVDVCAPHDLDPHAFRSNSYLLQGRQEAALLRQIRRYARPTPAWRRRLMAADVDDLHAFTGTDV